MSPSATEHDFPIPRECPFAPPPRYAELLEHEPISQVTLPGGRKAWLVARHDLVRQLMVDRGLSSNLAHPNYPMILQLPPEVLVKQQEFGQALINADPPEHTERRQMVQAEFTSRRMRELRSRIQEIVDDHLDAMLAGPQPADLVADLAVPVASMVISELLGVPAADRKSFQDNTRLMAHPTSTPQDSVRANRELGEYFASLVASKQAAPGEDLLSRLVTRNEETGVFTPQLLVGITQQLLLAGFETTASMIALGTLALLENPEQQAAFTGDPELAPNAVEELLRYLTIVSAVYRVTTADIKLGETTIRAGEGVIALVGAANWDPAEFDSPEKLDTARPRPHHMSFGYGIHQCIGQNLARIELEVVYRTLFTRVPTLHSAAALDELPFKKTSPFYGLWEFPVSW
ncbi:cytochrome P450 [Streptomyces iranensis]|nr:cytochrome P450 [Streptomyces iranensis]